MKSCYSYQKIQHMLQQSGLLVYEHLSPSDIQGRYFKNRKDDLSAFETIHYIHAVKNKHKSRKTPGAGRFSYLPRGRLSVFLGEYKLFRRAFALRQFGHSEDRHKCCDCSQRPERKEDRAVFNHRIRQKRRNAECGFTTAEPQNDCNCKSSNRPVKICSL